MNLNNLSNVVGAACLGVAFNRALIGDYKVAIVLLCITVFIGHVRSHYKD